jgi:hypothetical protein
MSGSRASGIAVEVVGVPTSATKRSRPAGVVMVRTVQGPSALTTKPCSTLRGCHRKRPLLCGDLLVAQLRLDPPTEQVERLVLVVVDVRRRGGSRRQAHLHHAERVLGDGSTRLDDGEGAQAVVGLAFVDGEVVARCGDVM